MSNTVIEQLKNIIANDLDTNLTIEEVDENSSLFEDGLAIDSLAVVELISLTEDKFNIQFEDDDLTPENFVNITSLANLINQKLSDSN
jgi:acyl carrier protein